MTRSFTPFLALGLVVACRTPGDSGLGGDTALVGDTAADTEVQPDTDIDSDSDTEGIGCLPPSVTVDNAEDRCTYPDQVLVLSGLVSDPVTAPSDLTVELRDSASGGPVSLQPATSGRFDHVDHYSPGEHTLTVTATNECGASASAELTLNVACVPTPSLVLVPETPTDADDITLVTEDVPECPAVALDVTWTVNGADVPETDFTLPASLTEPNDLVIATVETIGECGPLGHERSLFTTIPSQP